MSTLSVVLAVYGRSNYFAEQINSIVQGTLKPDEIIIMVDKHPSISFSDGEITELVGDIPVKIFRSKSNLGPAEAFRRAILKSSGDIICMCDQDDVWVQHKLSEIHRYHKIAVATIHQGLLLRSDNLDLANESLYTDNPLKVNFFRSLLKNNVYGCTMSINGPLLRSIAEKTRFSPMHDWVLFVILKVYSRRIIFIERPLFYYRRHAENHTQLVSQNSLGVKFKFRLQLFINLVRYVC